METLEFIFNLFILIGIMLTIILPFFGYAKYNEQGFLVKNEKEE